MTDPAATTTTTATTTATTATTGPDGLACVRWLSPKELLRTGVKAVLASVFGQYADKREMQQGDLFRQDAFRHGAAGEDFWFDYVSDVGDGFDATYSVASLVAGDLPVAGADVPVLPRAGVVVMGGDQVYPSADVEAYERRTTKVYGAALPEGSVQPAPALYAIPGNHDWYDGLTAFLRVFGQEASIGAWRTAQRRSYFALELPEDWWLLAVDIQLDTYIDQPQLKYFEDVAATIGEHASIIVCTAKPSWYHAPDPTGVTGSQDNLGYFLETVLGAKVAQVRLMLSGDVHHYARYVQTTNGKADPYGQTLVTAGHGGAYASSTHRLPPTLSVAAGLADPAGAKDDRVTYVRQGGTWPTQDASRRAARRVLWRLPTRNQALVPLLSALYGLLGVSAFAAAWLWSGLLLGLAGAGCVAFARPESGGPWVKRGWGLSLAVLQLLPAAGMVLWFTVAKDGWSWAVEVGAAAGAALVGGPLAAVLLAGWLFVVSRYGVNENELDAAQSIEDHKGFLRMRVGARDGALTIYPIGVPEVGRDWVASTGAGPCWVPRSGPIRHQLVEGPVTIPRTPRPAVPTSPPAPRPVREPSPSTTPQPASQPSGASA